jgi:hypothetical protein
MLGRSLLSSTGPPSPNRVQNLFLSILDRFAWKRHLRSRLLRQIFPPRILRLNQSDLLRPRPALQLLLTSNRLLNIIKAFVVHQPIAVIFAGKSFDLSALVFEGRRHMLFVIPMYSVPDRLQTMYAKYSWSFKALTRSQPTLCHPERSECFAKRRSHGVEGPRVRVQGHCRCKAFSHALHGPLRERLAAPLPLPAASGSLDSVAPALSRRSHCAQDEGFIERAARYEPGHACCRARRTCRPR